MSKQSVFCIASTSEQADIILDQLKASNFYRNDISVLYPDKESTHNFAHEKSTKAPEGIVTGVIVGGILGATLGWLASIGTLTLPMNDSLVDAGPIMSALSGSSLSAILGGIVGLAIGNQIPEFIAKRYEGKIKESNILISVHTDKSDEVPLAKSIFMKAGAHDICDTGDSCTQKENKNNAMGTV